MLDGHKKCRRLIPVACLAILLHACTPRSEPEPAPPAAPAAPPAAALPVPPPPLARAQMLAAVEEVASAAAAGLGYPASVRQLEGRRFALRLPFGCRGPSADDARLRYAYDPERRTVRLTALPEDWTEAAWARALVGQADAESIEGFWIRRPWMRTETCPAATAADPAAPPPTPQSVGLAQVFATGGSRLLRRGERPYEVTRKLDGEGAPPAGGFRLVLEGRLVASGQAPAIACRSDHPDRRPVCLVRVEIDRVAFEDAAGEMLAEWGT